MPQKLHSSFFLLMQASLPTILVRKKNCLHFLSVPSTLPKTMHSLLWGLQESLRQCMVLPRPNCSRWTYKQTRSEFRKVYWLIDVYFNCLCFYLSHAFIFKNRETKCVCHFESQALNCHNPSTLCHFFLSLLFFYTNHIGHTWVAHGSTP